MHTVTEILILNNYNEAGSTKRTRTTTQTGRARPGRHSRSILYSHLD